MILDFILGIIDIIFVYFLFLFLKTREKRQEWYGTVEKKKTLKGYSLSRYGHVVFFRKDDGKGKKLRMEQEDFNLYQEGKRYYKKIGEYLPDPKSGI